MSLYGLKEMDECGYCGILRDEPCSRFCSRTVALTKCSTARDRLASLDSDARVHEPGERRAYVPRQWLAFAHEVIGCCEAVVGPIGKLAVKARALVAQVPVAPHKSSGRSAPGQDGSDFW